MYVLYLSPTGKNWQYNTAPHQLFIDSKETNYSVMKEVSYNILSDFDIAMELSKISDMCQINQTVNKDR